MFPGFATIYNRNINVRLNGIGGSPRSSTNYEKALIMGSGDERFPESRIKSIGAVVINSYAIFHNGTGSSL